MAKTKISEFSSTPGNNTDIDSINIAEGCAPSGINDAIRELMAQLKDFQTGAAGDSFNGPVGTTTAAAGAFTTLTTSSTVTHNAGTANGVAYLNGSKVLTSGSALTFDGTNFATTGSVTSAGASNSGNLTFTGTGNRITGDFSNAAFANRVMFQTSTVNGNTAVEAIPNGTGVASRWTAYGNSDPTNASFMQIGATGASEALLEAGRRGTGTYLPMAFLTGGSERMRIDTSGNVGIGTSSPSYPLDVAGIARSNAWIGRTNGSAPTADCAVYRPADNTLGFSTANVERARIDSSGNVGIGTSSPAAKLNIIGNTLIPLTNSYYCYTANYGMSTGTGLELFCDTGDVMRFITGGKTGTERARIDSSGNLFVGTTGAVLTTARATFRADSGAAIISAVNTNTNLFCVNTNNTSWAPISFRFNTATEVGRIDCTSTATSYVTSSDYRLKEDIKPMTGALDRVASLKPVTYKWKADGSDGEGFIAHELAEVCPDAVTGEKDAVDADGNPQYQGIDTSFLVATITAAIQEQQALIESLKARLDAANL